MHHRRTAIVSLAVAGSLWGLTVPLSKLALEWLGPGWLTVGRFALAAPLLALVARGRLRAALTPRIALSGALGYGAVILLQNAGIERTSVSHAALVVGAVPVLVALVAAGLGRATARPLTWGGYALALGGVGLVAGAGGAGSSVAGDLLVLLSVAGSAGFIVAQPGLLAGRDPAAVTAVQLAAGALAALPVAALMEGTPGAPAQSGALIATLALALAGTALPFWLFALGQSRVPADVAGAFVNLEPVVGAATGWVAFGEAVSAGALAGGAAVLAGIVLTTHPGRSGGVRRAAPRRRVTPPPRRRPAPTAGPTGEWESAPSREVPTHTKGSDHHALPPPHPSREHRLRRAAGRPPPPAPELGLNHVRDHLRRPGRLPVAPPPLRGAHLCGPGGSRVPEAPPPGLRRRRLVIVPSRRR